MRVTLRAQRITSILIMVSLCSLIRAGLGPVQADQAGESSSRYISAQGVACRVIGPAPFGIAPLSTCPGVRPGSAVYVAGAGTCTLNFLFAGSDGRKYIGTAGHCVPTLYNALDPASISGGEVVYAHSSGPEVKDSRGAVIGNIAYGRLTSTEDFALIRLNDLGSGKANPAMCHFGGPVGYSTDLTSTPTMIHYYGNGVGAAQTLPARSGHSAWGMPSNEHVLATGFAISGDSGSPVITPDGRAIGVLVAIGAMQDLTESKPAAGTILITRPWNGTSQIDRARQKIGLSSLALMTAPLASG